MGVKDEGSFRDGERLITHSIRLVAEFSGRVTAVWERRELFLLTSWSLVFPEPW